MPEASRRVLLDLFSNGLHFAPNVDDIRAFEKILKVVSPSLIRASLAEIRDSGQIGPMGVLEWRDAVFKIYNRKVAEHAQLFPVFHSYETALRSTVAVLLEEYYKTAKWWEPSKKALQSGEKSHTVKQIAHVTISPAIARVIYNVVSDLIEVKKVNFTTIASGYELLEQTDLGHVGMLIDEHWPIFKQLFIRDGVALPRHQFLLTFKKMKEARNSVYHHHSFSGLNYVFQTAEEILAYLDFPLPRVHKQIAEVECVEPPYKGLRP